jgi:hypothetical protein
MIWAIRSTSPLVYRPREVIIQPEVDGYLSTDFSVGLHLEALEQEPEALHDRARVSQGHSRRNSTLGSAYPAPSVVYPPFPVYGLDCADNCELFEQH